MAGPEDDVTALLIASSHGNRQMLDRLMAVIYEDLRTLARARLRGERRHRTIDTVALVHEAYLKLVGIPDRLGVLHGLTHQAPGVPIGQPPPTGGWLDEEDRLPLVRALGRLVRLGRSSPPPWVGF